jgi:hypothetical protein
MTFIDQSNMKSGVQQNMATSDLTLPSVKGFAHFLDTHNFRFYFGVQVPFIFIFFFSGMERVQCICTFPSKDPDISAAWLKW